jgi:translation elongation factor EF-G
VRCVDGDATRFFFRRRVNLIVTFGFAAKLLRQYGRNRCRQCGLAVINAMVPLMNMFGYVNNLRSMSQGRATFTMQFDHYSELPANVSAEVQKKFA